MRKEVQEDNYLSVKELGNYSILKCLNKKERKLLANQLLERHYKAGELVYRINYPHTVLYFVAEGEINIFLEKNGKSFDLINKRQYEHFGEIGLFLEINRTASARAIDDTVLLALTKKDFDDFIHLYPKAGTKILKAIGSLLCEIIINNNEKIQKISEKSDETHEKED